MVYLFIAYFVLWAVTFGYLYSLGARQRRLERELDLFQERQGASRQEEVS